MRGLGQRARHFVVGKLGEVEIVVTEGMEARWLTEAHDPIRFLSELGQCVRARHGDCYDDLARRSPFKDSSNDK